MKNIFLLLSIILVSYVHSNAQGCVAIRSNGNSCNLSKPGDIKGWQLNFNTRYFKSYKHFVGTIEQQERVKNGTEVINHAFSMDFTITKYLNSRWSFTLNTPLLSNVRSSLYEHGGNSGGEAARNETRSVGIGDIRATVYRWLFDPVTHHKGNLQAGFGIKLPTGDYRSQDYFYKLDGSYTIGPVDQSIQLGDGGTGFAFELNGYKSFNHNLGAYGNLYYLINPKDQNGVSTARGGTSSATSLQYFTSTMSVPDQYMARAGVNYMKNQFTFSGGVRIEGIPSSDLIGGDKGFRRPGYVISAEPMISYMTKKMNYYLSIPVALQRNRIQSYADKLRTAATGTKVHGDAAFADYLVNVGFSVHL